MSEKIPETFGEWLDSDYGPESERIARAWFFGRASRDAEVQALKSQLSAAEDVYRAMNRTIGAQQKVLDAEREHVKALREALVEARAVVHCMCTKDYEPCFGCRVTTKIDAALALTEAPTEAMVEDEHGECPNCANPPHVGPCRRKQPKDLAGASALPPCSVPGDVDWWKGVAQQMGLRIFVAEKALREIALNHAEPARTGVTKALNALNGEFPDAVGHVPSEAPQEKP